MTNHMSDKAIEWIDETAYAQDDKDRKPRIWTTKTKNLRIAVHYYTGCGDEWFVTCRDLNVKCRPLKTTDVATARAEAVRFLMRHAKKIVAELSALDT